MKKKILLALLLLVPIGVTGSTKAWRKASNTAFHIGEEMIFEVGWKAATAGEVVIRVDSMGLRQKRKAYKVVCTAKTNKFIDAVFMVRDQLESWIDAESLSSLSFSKRTQEGSTLVNEDTFVNPVVGTFKHRKMKPKKQSAATITEGQTVTYVQDPLSALYYVRNQSLSAGKTVSIPILSGTKTETMTWSVVRTETIQTALGRFACIVLSYKHPKASVVLWLSNDTLKRPMKLAAELPFGEITADLIGFTPSASK